MRIHRKIENKHIVDTLFVLTLFAVFAVCSMLLIAFGANIYQKTVDNMEDHFNIYTSVTYISEKIRQSDSASSLEVVDFGDSDAFKISSNVDGTDYLTYIYMNDGYLKELYIKADHKLEPKAGQKLLPITRFDITEESPGLYSYVITDDNDSTLVMKISSKCD